MFTRSVGVTAFALGVASATILSLAGPVSAGVDSITITSTAPSSPGEVRVNWDASLGYPVDYFLITDYSKGKSSLIGGQDGIATSATSGLLTYLSYSTTYNVIVTAVGVDANFQTSSAPVKLQGYRLLSSPSAYVVKRGESVSISGSLHLANTETAVTNAQIKLQARPAGADSWQTVDTANTNNQGDFTTSHQPTRNTDYRVWYSGDGAGGWRTPLPISVKVAITRTVSPNPVDFDKPATFNGKVRAPSSLVSGQTIRLQRKTAAGWNTVANDTVSGTSGYSINYTSPNRDDSSYRLLLTSSANFATSVSRAVRLTVN